MRVERGLPTVVSPTSTAVPDSLPRGRTAATGMGDDDATRARHRQFGGNRAQTNMEAAITMRCIADEMVKVGTTMSSAPAGLAVEWTGNLPLQTRS